MYSKSYSFFVLFILLLVYILNQWHRYLLPYLSGVSIPDCPSKEKVDVCYVPQGAKEVSLCDACPSEGVKDFWPQCVSCHKCLEENDAGRYNLRYGACISKAQYGILAGFGFSLLYVIAGLFAGRISDLFNRKNVIVFALVFWSLAAASQGLATNFAMMLLSRVALGIGEAFSAPPAYSLIADFFPVESRATANGIYSFGVYVGGGLSSLSIVMAKGLGWVTTTYVAGFIGLGVAVVMFFTVTEPERTSDKPQETNEISAMDAIRITLSKPVLVALFFASALRFLGGYSIGAYLPIFYSRVFPDYNSQYSVLNAGVVSVGGALSSYLGGYIADIWSKKTIRARAWIPAIGALLGLAPFVATVFASNFYISIIGLFFEYLFAECWFGPALSIIQNELPANVRGTAVALYLFIGTLGGNAGPAIIGVVDPGTSGIRYVLFIMVAISYGGCAVMFFVTSVLMQKQKNGSEEPLLNETQEETQDQNQSGVRTTSIRTSSVDISRAKSHER